MSEILFNKGKRIGLIIYLVEDNVIEMEMIKHIYMNILNYNVVAY